MTSSEALHYLSLMFLAYAKSQESTSQEVQAISLEGHVITSSNSHTEGASLIDFFSTESNTTRGRAGIRLYEMFHQSSATMRAMELGSFIPEIPRVQEFARECQMRSANIASTPKNGIIPHVSNPASKPATGATMAVFSRSSPEVCARELDPEVPGQLHILSGGGTLHAEQRLLLVLAWRLAKGKIPKADVVISGVKPPCKTCEPVLKAFSKTFREVYKAKTHAEIVFDDSGTGQNKPLLEKLSLGDVTDMTDPLFQSFVEKYNSHF